MPIKASCPSCQKSYTVADTQLGKKVRCKDCAYVFEVHPDDEDAAITDGPRAEARLSGAGKRTDPDDRPDQDDRPARRPARDRDEDEDDRPRRRRGRDEDEDDRPRRKTKPKKGGIPAWVWLVAGGGVLLMMLMCGGAVGLWAFGTFKFGNTVTKENYDKIKTDMSEAEVRAILGRPTEAVANNPFGGAFNAGRRGRNTDNVKFLAWKNGDDAIVCGFLNDKLILKDINLRNQR